MTSSRWPLFSYVFQKCIEASFYTLGLEREFMTLFKALQTRLELLMASNGSTYDWRLFGEFILRPPKDRGGSGKGETAHRRPSLL